MIRNASGLTLIEVLVAISLMGVVILGLSSMGVTTIRADTNGRRVSAATALAQTKLEELRIYAVRTQPGMKATTARPACRRTARAEARIPESGL